MKINGKILKISLLILVLLGSIVGLWKYISKSQIATEVAYDKEYFDAWSKLDSTYSEYLNSKNTYDQTDFRKCLSLIDAVYARHNYITPYGRIQKYYRMILYYYKHNYFDTSLIYVDSAQYVLEKDNLEKTHSKDYLHILVSKADINFSLHNYGEAFNYYFKAKKFAQGMLDKKFLDEYSYFIGMTLYKQKKYLDAAHEFQTSFLETDNIFKVENSGVDAKPLYKMQETLSNIALCYSKLNMNDSALFYYDSALIFIENNKHNFAVNIKPDVAIGVVYGNVASIYIRQGQLDTAETLLKKSIAINECPNCENYDAQKTKMKLATLYYQKGDLKQLFETLSSLRKGLDTLHDDEVENDWTQYMYLYYDKIRQPLKAYEFYKKYINKRDSLDNRNKEQLQTDILQNMHDKEQQYQITLLKRDKDNSNTFLIIAIVITILVLLLAALIFSNYLRSSKKNILINNQKILLEGSIKEKERILNVVAHDLRSPVSGVAYLAEMMRDDELSADKKELLELIRSSSYNSLNLINELVGLSFEEMKNLTLSETDMNELIKETVKLLEYKIQEKKQALQINVPLELKKVWVDREKMGRLINNMLYNSIKFTPVGGAIRLVIKKEAGKMILSVQDNGIGIPKNLIPQMFDMMVDTKRNGTSGEKSFGLGLSICKQIVEAHHGEIWVESEEGKGSTFFVELPV